jgi:hypothetical protein
MAKTHNKGIIGQLRGSVAAPVSAEQRLVQEHDQLRAMIERAPEQEQLKILRQSGPYLRQPEQLASYEQLIALTAPDHWALSVVDLLPVQTDSEQFFLDLAIARAEGVNQFFAPENWTEKSAEDGRISRLAALIAVDLKTVGEPQISASLLVQNALQSEQNPKRRAVLRALLLTQEPHAAVEGLLKNSEDGEGFWAWFLLNERQAFLKALEKQGGSSETG